MNHLPVICVTRISQSLPRDNSEFVWIVFIQSISIDLEVKLSDAYVRIYRYTFFLSVFLSLSLVLIHIELKQECDDQMRELNSFQ
jgi:hypothetical protein